MKRLPRYLQTVVVAAAIGISACADSVSPDRSPDVLGQVGGKAVTDSSPSVAADTTLPPGRLRGMVIATSPDSTTPWRPVATVRLDVAQRERNGSMTVVATTTSNAAGRFVFDKLDVPAGLLFVRATPTSGSAYRATRWLPAYAFVSDWMRVGTVGDIWTLGPYVILEPSGAAVTDFAPMLLIGRVVGELGGPAIEGASVVIERALAPATDGRAVTTGPVVSGRTDANGFFLITLPGPGLYAARTTTPATSPYGDMPMSGTFVPAANAETSVSTYFGMMVRRR